MAGLFEDSRIANWIPSRAQPWLTQSLMITSRASSVTVLASTTL
jgi:hypothetical protein